MSGVAWKLAPRLPSPTGLIYYILTHVSIQGLSPRPSGPLRTPAALSCPPAGPSNRAPPAPRAHLSRRVDADYISVLRQDSK